MAITRVESLVYGVSDVEKGIRYFDDWGLEPVERGAAGAIFRTPVGQTVHIRPMDDASLPSAPDGDKSTVRRTVWGVDSADDLETIGAELSRDRDVARDADGTLHSVDEVGFAISFAIARPVAVDAAPEPANFNEDSKRLNAESRPPTRVRPLRLGHVVYFVARDDQPKAAEFYLARLNFRLSDRTLDGGDFMRCEGSRDHHNLFLVRRTDFTAFNHAAFEVHNLDEIVSGGSFMKNAGWEPETTVGRHYLGSNMYWYFRNPSGGNTEYFADMDCMDDNWKPRIWEKGPGFAQWTMDPSDFRPASPADAALPTAGED